MKILVVDHNAILASDRAVYRKLSAVNDVSLTLVVPKSWTEYYGTLSWEKEESSLEVIGVPSFFTGKSHRVFYPNLKRILKNYKPDILYVEAEPESYLAWQAVRARELITPSAKVVFMSWRNIDYKGKFPYKLSFLNAIAEQVVLERADYCVAHSEAAKEIFCQRGFTNVTVIPPAVDTSIFRKVDVQELRKKLGLTSFTLGYFGRFIPEKGVDLLLKAVTTLPFDCQVLLLGDGPAKTEWKKLAQELKIEHKVIWVEPVPHPKIADYFNALDVFVLPSYSGTYWKEQFGRVLIEAMACEIPVIGSNSGEIPRVIGDAGLVVQEKNIDDMQKKIILLYNNHTLKNELIRKGKEKVRRLYTVDNIAEQYVQLFSVLVNSKAVSC